MGAAIEYQIVVARRKPRIFIRAPFPKPQAPALLKRKEKSVSGGSLAVGATSSMKYR